MEAGLFVLRVLTGAPFVGLVARRQWPHRQLPADRPNAGGPLRIAVSDAAQLATQPYSPAWAECSPPPTTPLPGAGQARRWSAGTVVDGRYLLGDRLGTGGTASVYRAEDLQLNRDVALKVLHRELAADRDSVERFRREARSAAGLCHRHIVTVFDRGQWDGTHYIAMEYVAGRSLTAVIREEAPIAPERAIDLTVQILRAARFIHRRGILHRDLKPGNAIVDHEGRLKVTDFGIARSGPSDITRTGSILGTVSYLSPEQAQGGVLSGASDLYSIGVILYELLAGRVPFRAESAVTVALKHVSERPTPPSAFNPAVTPELEAAEMRALEKDPARRFPDADAFIGALEVAKGPSAVTRPDPPAEVRIGIKRGKRPRAGSILLGGCEGERRVLEGGVVIPRNRRTEAGPSRYRP